MEKPTKVFIGGTVLAALIFGGAAANSMLLLRELQQSQRACEKEAVTSPIKSGAFSGQLVCEADVLTRDLYKANFIKPPGVQGRVIDAQVAVWNDPLGGFVGLAIVVWLLSATPWLWYFFLRRLKEVSEAVRSK